MKLYLLPLAGLLLAGCTAEVLDESKDLVPVSLTVNISESAETRAGTSLLTAFSDEVLGIALTNCIDGSGAALASTTYTVGTGFASQPYISTDPATIKGYYPDSARTASSFSVQADQTSDDNYKASDLLYAETTATKAAPSPTLTFTHKMSKVIVNVTPTSGVSSVTSVTLNNINRTVAFTPATGVLGALSNPGDISMSNEGAALIPPQTTNGDNNFLTIVTDVGTAYYKLAMEFVGGKVYTININVEKSSIGLTTTITNWDGATVNVDYNHGDGLALARSIKMNPLWWMAQYNMASNRTSFVAAHSTSSPYFFTYSTASSENVVDYHLPTCEEFASVIPTDNFLSNSSNIAALSSTLDSPASYSETGCDIGGTNVTASTSWWSGSNLDWYAVRFIGTDYASAWHYKWVTSPCNGLLIESYLLSVANEAEAKDILKDLSSSTIFTGSYPAGTANLSPASTTTTISGFCQRFLPACGYNNYGGTSSPAYVGSIGDYWTSSLINGNDSSRPGVGWQFGTSSGYRLFMFKGPVAGGYSVRLFRDY